MAPIQAEQTMNDFLEAVGLLYLTFLLVSILYVIGRTIAGHDQ